MLATAVLAVPAASAHAQGAGDDQYQDPFGDEQQEEATPAPTAAPTTAPPPVQPAATPAPPSSTPQPEDALPYTGIDGWPVAIAGALLLGAGLTLRVRLRADERP